MSEKVIKVKTEKGNTILIPKENISFIVEGDRGINYVCFKSGIPPVETTRDIDSLKKDLEN